MSKNTSVLDVILLSLADSVSPIVKKRHGVLMKCMSEVVCTLGHVNLTLGVCSVPQSGAEYCCYYTWQPYTVCVIVWLYCMLVQSHFCDFKTMDTRQISL